MSLGEGKACPQELASKKPNNDKLIKRVRKICATPD
jgi:hypothetical protein